MNPFKYGQVVSSKDFCPRPVLINQLKMFIQSGQNVVVQGERRMGKTSLIHEAAREFKECRMLYIDLMEIKTAEDLCKRILSALISLERRAGFWKKILGSLAQLRPVISLDPITGQPHLSIDAGIKIRPESIEALLDLIKDVKGRKTLVVVFDEFQGMLNLPRSSEILAVMRSKIQFHSHICYIFAGSIRNQMSHIFNDPNSAFFKSAVPLDVGSIDSKSFVPFLLKKFVSGKRKIEKDTLKQVMEIAEIISGDVQALCSCLWETSSPGDHLSTDNIQLALELIYARESKGYEPILAALTGLQFKCLIGIAQLGGNSLHSIEFRKKVGIDAPASVQKALKRLVDSQIIYRLNDQYKFVNPFLKSWLIWKGF